ncbi:RluA family pseudouridine synthase [Criblamydia sequanensis]|uniref:Pseudouridine synthase n=1 Tax=Candidatus Criblamydia sequanensis CRIB-18 TaxID=1437425 RepID=A0A090CXZ6_9BACT|nr:RluA family pseudouridine synthase [Criblamydia sequanensis]CDR33006.1 Ribosomal large subunit pseudouridine synthase D [Criblamydia sequanensis CRIB-18]
MSQISNESFSEDDEEEEEIFIISKENANIRLDRVLHDHYKDLHSRTYFQYLFQNQCIQVNGKAVKKQFKPKVQDRVSITFLSLEPSDLIPENIPLKIIYEDKDILVLDKPRGMVVHPAPGNWTGTLVNAILYHVTGMQEAFKDEEKRPGIVHRLDKDTSGVIIAAKNLAAHKKLIHSFSERKVFKEYLGVCIGNPGRGIVNEPIGRDPKNRKQMCVAKTGGKEAITEFETLKTDGKFSLVRFVIKTGRTHQIRVHMQHRKTPLLGDTVYGDLKLNKKLGIEGQLLHASKLSLIHPSSLKPLTFTAAIPDDIEKMAHRILEKNN